MGKPEADLGSCGSEKLGGREANRAREASKQMWFLGRG